MERNRVASILATLGIGTTAAMYPEKSEAATSVVPGVKPGLETDSLNPLPSRGQEAVDAALRLARNTPRAALDIGNAASYAIPGFGEARAVKELASIAASAPSSGAGKRTIDPRQRAEEMRQDYEKMQADQNIADAQAEDRRQREEMKPPSTICQTMKKACSRRAHRPQKLRSTICLTSAPGPRRSSGARASGAERRHTNASAARSRLSITPLTRMRRPLSGRKLNLLPPRPRRRLWNPISPALGAAVYQGCRTKLCKTF
jgi:hypothetical protein